MKTKREIIEFVADYFENNPRSIDGRGRCVYNGPNGEHCAFALCCENPKDLSNLEGKAASTVIGQLGWEILKGDFRIEDRDFWDEIQDFHDSFLNWKDGELSESGKFKKRKLLEKYD